MALSDRVVVMQRGRILQVGSPETVYRRPESRDVASFFGSPNLIDARVTNSRRSDNGDFILSVEGAGWIGHCQAGREFAAGSRVQIVVRPEDFSLAAADRAASNGELIWKGRVIEGVFRGPRRSLTVETSSARFHVEYPATGAVRIGETVSVLTDSRNAWAISSE